MSSPSVGVSSWSCHASADWHQSFTDGWATEFDRSLEEVIEPPMKIQRVAVIGLGTMGHGIAQTFAMAGCDVTGFDDVQAAGESLHDRVRQNLQDFVAAELFPADQVDGVLKRITVASSEVNAVRDSQ